MKFLHSIYWLNCSDASIKLYKRCQKMSGQFLAEMVGDVETKKQPKTEVKEPRKYKVILLNDDYTPMDFVVRVLQQFFQHSEEKATQIMLQIHLQGRSICGIYTRDIAETKVVQVTDYARQNDHPLLCGMEPE